MHHTRLGIFILLLMTQQWQLCSDSENEFQLPYQTELEEREVHHEKFLPKKKPRLFDRMFDVETQRGDQIEVWNSDEEDSE